MAWRNDGKSLERELCRANAERMRTAVRGSCRVAYYNLTWDVGKMIGKKHEEHKRKLREDVLKALDTHDVDVLCLCEVGEIERGLGSVRWNALLRDIIPEHWKYEFYTASHYTTIINSTTMETLIEPTLSGSMTPVPAHWYRKCQFFRVRKKYFGEVHPAIDVVNVHSPSSKHKHLTDRIRKDVLEWLQRHMGDRTIIGGDLNESEFSLRETFGPGRGQNGIEFIRPIFGLHGDLAITRNLETDVMQEKINATSITHFMVIVNLCPLGKPEPLACMPAETIEAAGSSACQPAQSSVSVKSSAKSMAHTGMGHDWSYTGEKEHWPAEQCWSAWYTREARSAGAGWGSSSAGQPAQSEEDERTGDDVAETLAPTETATGQLTDTNEALNENTFPKETSVEQHR